MSILADSNFDDVANEGGFSASGKIPPGTYDGKVISAKSEHHTNGYPRVTIRFEVTSGDLTRSTMFHDFNLTPPKEGKKKSGKGAWFGACSALGSDKNNEQDMVGRLCIFRVAEEPAVGNFPAKLKVVAFMPPIQSATDDASPSPAPGKMPSRKRDDDVPF